MRVPGHVVLALFKTGLAVALATILAGPGSAQDWRGQGRMQGAVLDANGQPIVGATLKASNRDRSGEGTTIKTDKKGRWVLGGVAAGTWDIDVSAEGYQVRKISVNLPSEESRLAPVEVRLDKAAPPAGSELAQVAAAADADYKAGRYAEARQEYEKVLAQRPDLTALIEQQIGFSYIQEKNFKSALEHLEKAVAADPQNQNLHAIAAQAALEAGDLAKGKELLAGLDESAITSADVYFNMGVNFFNAGAADDAISYFGKAIKLDASHVDAYYRRALAYLGQGKSAEAKADFQKVVELQPDGEMAKMSKKALDQLK